MLNSFLSNYLCQTYTISDDSMNFPSIDIVARLAGLTIHYSAEITSQIHCTLLTN